jgi:hypothetical protein
MGEVKTPYNLSAGGKGPLDRRNEFGDGFDESVITVTKKVESKTDVVGLSKSWHRRTVE